MRANYGDSNYSKAAFSINIIFKEFNIPAGAKLFIFSNDGSQVIGAFTKKMLERRSFCHNAVKVMKLLLSILN